MRQVVIRWRIRLLHALICVVVFSGTGVARAQQFIAINEINYAPSLAAAETLRFEYVELFNPGSSSVSLDGWQLRDSDHLLFDFPNISLPARAFLTVYANAANGTLAEDTDFGDLSGRLIGTVSWGASNGLANAGDAVQLFYVPGGGGTIVDFVYYDEANLGDPTVDDAAVDAGIWKNGAAIDTLAGSTTGRAIALRIDGASPNEVNPVGDAEEIDWMQYSGADGGTPGQANLVIPEPPSVALLLGAGFSLLLRRSMVKRPFRRSGLIG